MSDVALVILDFPGDLMLKYENSILVLFDKAKADN